MAQSVSICFPVRNAQEHLEANIERIMDLMTELTSRFDIVIVDDGSTDDTIDVARELSRKYPQVAAVRHDQAQGMAAAVETGLGKCSGDVAIVHATNQPAEIDALRRLCHSAAEQPASTGPATTAVPSATEPASRPAISTTKRLPPTYRGDRILWIDRLMGWQTAAQPTSGGSPTEHAPRIYRRTGVRSRS